MFKEVSAQVLILFILILIGFILAKAKVLGDKSVKGMTDLVLYTVTPCVIIKSFIREFEPKLLKNLLLSFLIAFSAHILFIALSRIFLRSNNKSQEKVLQFAVIFSNCGFMSIPLQQALLGDMGVFYGSSYVAIFNLFIWSYGILLMSGDKAYLTPKKLVINPGVIGLTVGVVIFLASIPVPRILGETVGYMAALNTPLPMIIIGYHLYNSSLLEGFKNLKCLFAVFLRVVLFPLLALGVMYLCGVRGVMLISSVISCCAPSAAITTMLSAKFERDTALSVNMVSLSTLLSLVTMPLIITLTELIA